MELYSGVRELAVESSIIDELSMLGVTTITGTELFPNEFVLLRAAATDKPMIVRHTSKGVVKRHEPVASMLPPRNKEQSWAFELLYDESVKLVTLTGPAGVGKSLLAIAAGKQQLDRKRYSCMLVTRPIVTLGRDLGYLPGTVEEKMAPWIAPIKDNLKFLLDYEGTKKGGKRSSMQMLFDNDIIEIEAVAYIRGRSLPNTYMIVDEAQNLDLASLKTIITRAGEGTKIVLTGDLDQVDTKIAPGLPVVIERFKEEVIAGHISLLKGERSALATIASQIL